jgi:hypothetical protein
MQARSAEETLAKPFGQYRLNATDENLQCQTQGENIQEPLPFRTLSGVRSMGMYDCKELVLARLQSDCFGPVNPSFEQILWQICQLLYRLLPSSKLTFRLVSCKSCFRKVKSVITSKFNSRLVHAQSLKVNF